MTERCHWVRAEDGFTTLIPGCWDRVHNPDAPCTCGEWSEEEARRVINGLRENLYRERHENQRLRAALAKQLFAGVRLFLVAHQMAQRPRPPEPPQPERIIGGAG